MVGARPGLDADRVRIASACLAALLEVAVVIAKPRTSPVPCAARAFIPKEGALINS